MRASTHRSGRAAVCPAGEAMYKNAGDAGSGESAQYEDVKKDDDKKEEEKKDDKK